MGAGGYRLGNAEVYDSVLRDGLNDAFSEQHSGWHTEDLVKSRQITREEQDRWAERSQKRFSAAQAAGKFVAEIAPVELCERNKPGLFQKDEHNRPETTLESLAKLRPAFRKDGTITAGNAPGLNSGAAAMIVSEADRGQQLFRIGGGRGDQPVRVELGAALATVVGVLIEVPVMLSVVWIVNRSKGWNESGAKSAARPLPSHAQGQ